MKPYRKGIMVYLIELLSLLIVLRIRIKYSFPLKWLRFSLFSQSEKYELGIYLTKLTICESVFHCAKDCQHNRYANVQTSQDVQGDEDDECNRTLFTNAKSDNEIFMTESFSCVFIDTACTRTVCGKK